MQIQVSSGDLFEIAAPLVVIPVPEGETPTQLSGLFESGDFSGAAKQTLMLYPRGAARPQRVLLVGMGKREQISAETLRAVGALATQRARDLKLASVTVGLPVLEHLRPEAPAQALVEGMLLGGYQYLRYRTTLPETERHTVAQGTVVAIEHVDDVRRGAAAGERVARGTILARDLANSPGNLVTPAYLGDVALDLAGRLGLQVTVLGQAELQAQGFGGILAVGQGSAQEPRFIVLEHGQPAEGRPTICLVGKGITFDTGGISIKPAEKMDEMKMDMSGAAAVLGTMQVVAELALPLHVVGLVAAAENMPGSNAYKPGDVITTLSGKTIEVLNTDAEGRIVLADALHYAQRYTPAATIDLATLTGAIQVALGPHAAGLMCNDDTLANRILKAGEQAGERAWRMPLWPEYREMITSEIADVKNSAGRFAGALTAAAFLWTFAGDRPWAHLDIAATAWTDSAARPHIPRGATGIGVRLLVELLRTWEPG